MSQSVSQSINQSINQSVGGGGERRSLLIAFVSAHLVVSVEELEWAVVLCNIIGWASVVVAGSVDFHLEVHCHRNDVVVRGEAAVMRKGKATQARRIESIYHI